MIDRFFSEGDWRATPSLFQVGLGNGIRLALVTVPKFVVHPVVPCYLSVLVINRSFSGTEPEMTSLLEWDNGSQLRATAACYLAWTAMAGI